MRVRQKLVDHTAEEILSKFPAPVGQPTNLETIASQLGVEIYERLLEPGLDGLSAVEDGKKYIILNEAMAPVRKRFTIAHELGHLLLHSDSPLNVTKEQVIFYRNEDSAKGELWKEIEANRFAANLLMPAKAIRDCLANATKDALTSSSLEELAKKFGVSSEAMAFRLGNLGYTA